MALETDLDGARATLNTLRKGGVTAFLFRLMTPWCWDMTREEHIHYLEVLIEEGERTRARLRELPRSGFRKTIREGKI